MHACARDARVTTVFATRFVLYFALRVGGELQPISSDSIGIGKAGSQSAWEIGIRDRYYDAAVYCVFFFRLFLPGYFSSPSPLRFLPWEAFLSPEDFGAFCPRRLGSNRYLILDT